MEAQSMMQSGRFVSLRVKLLIGFSLVFTIVFAGAYYWFYQFATDRAMQRIQDDMLYTLMGAASKVDGDELEALHREGVPNADGLTDDPRYWRQLEWLSVVHTIEPRAYLYTYVPGDKSKNEVIFITDVSVLYERSKAADFNVVEVLDDPEANYSGLETTTLYVQPYEDKWGHWISGYTAVRNSKGEVVAGLGIDFEAEYVFQVQQAIRDNVLTAFGLTYTALFLLVYLVSRELTQPIVVLAKAASQIGEGNYNQDLDEMQGGYTHDEINILAQVFESMVAKVRQREETLKKQVSELKIEIDEVKRQKQVNEIVDTDLFQDLQAKAKELRLRRRNPNPEVEVKE